MTRFLERASVVTSEISEALGRVDPGQVEALIDAVLSAHAVTMVGVGREGLAARAFAMRLMHSGITAHWVWDDTAPATGPGDLVIVISGSGEIGHVDHVAQRAKETGARLAVVTAEPSSRTAARANVLLRLPAAAYGATGDVISSIQPMGSLFEQVALLTLDVALIELVERQGLTLDSLAHRHRNVE